MHVVEGLGGMTYYTAGYGCSVRSLKWNSLAVDVLYKWTVQSERDIRF